MTAILVVDDDSSMRHSVKRLSRDVGLDLLSAASGAEADVFDALTTDRPYREALSRQKAVEVMRSMKGNDLDPDLVDVFIGELEKKRDKSTAAADAADLARRRQRGTRYG